MESLNLSQPKAFTNESDETNAKESPVTSSNHSDTIPQTSKPTPQQLDLFTTQHDTQAQTNKINTSTDNEGQKHDINPEAQHTDDAGRIFNQADITFTTLEDFKHYAELAGLQT